MTTLTEELLDSLDSCVMDWMNEGQKDARKALATTLSGLQMPEKLPRVTKRKDFYPPYQPQVEKHRRTGFNEAIDQCQAVIDALIADLEAV